MLVPRQQYPRELKIAVLLEGERIAELERKIGQQAMEIDFLKKALRRFREQVPPVAVDGAMGSMSKSGKRTKPPKRRSQ